ncbi:MAG TPA: class I SAM-dependent methyltransferase [Trichocoleus sp.]
MKADASSLDQIRAVARRYDHEFSGQAFELPAEVEEMPIFREWAAGQLTSRIAAPFWELARPKRGQRCLDIGCGVSFLIYPWRDWEALFYGQEVSAIAQKALTTRGPQLNSKLFKGCKLAPAHQLEYDESFFDIVIATGVSCYYSPDYWETVMAQVKRVLKPEGVFVFDVIDPDQVLAESWAILETYLGSEVQLEPLATWPNVIKASGARIVSQKEYDPFHLYKVKW